MMVSSRCCKPLCYTLAVIIFFIGLMFTINFKTSDITEPKAFSGEESYSRCRFCKSFDERKIGKKRNAEIRTLSLLGPVFLGVGVFIPVVVTIYYCKQSKHSSLPYSNPVQYQGSRTVFTGQNAMQIQQPRHYPQGAGYGGTHLTATHEMKNPRHSPIIHNPHHGHMPLHYPHSNNQEQYQSPLPSLLPQNDNWMTTNSDITESPAFNPTFQTQGVYTFVLQNIDEKLCLFWL